MGLRSPLTWPLSESGWPSAGCGSRSQEEALPLVLDVSLPAVGAQAQPQGKATMVGAQPFLQGRGSAAGG